MLPFHPYADLFPFIEGAEFAELVADIKANDLRERIVVLDGAILDGRNRYRAALAAGLLDEDDGPDRAKYFVRFVPSVDGDPLAFVLSKNLQRRHLDDRQRASVAAKVANLTRGRPAAQGEQNPPSGGISTDKAAAMLNVAPRQVERARTVHELGTEPVKQALDRGELPVATAERIARLPEPEQPAALERALPNGARAIMSSRQEPDDSLDYFPTPPWGTRALIDHVLPAAGVHSFGSAWEPACGEGHMAEVLRESFKTVRASDVHDYGYGECFDYLAGDGSDHGEPVDWIITNPPFDEKALAFVLRALAFAKVGVAMFVRWQWCESVGRYNDLFYPHPPTLVAPFVERINLCKGRWESYGSTATAYCWIVWTHRKIKTPTRLFWIPPGCRERCARPDDVERFTTHPVTKRDHVPEVPQQVTQAVEASAMSPCTQGDGAAIPANERKPPHNSDDGEDIPAFLRRQQQAAEKV